jgi:hypothetical protein
MDDVSRLRKVIRAPRMVPAPLTDIARAFRTRAPADNVTRPLVLIGSMPTNPYYQLETYQDGDIIARRGDEGRELYVVHSGRVVLMRDEGGDGIVEETRERGQFFGELSLFQGIPRQETAIAVGPTKLLVLEPGSVLLKIRRDPTFAFAMLQRITQRVVELEKAQRDSAEQTRTVSPPPDTHPSLSATLMHPRPSSDEARR